MECAFFYFYDAARNIAECIVRHDLNNFSDESFTIADLLCVNEIGLGTDDISKTNTQLEESLGSYFWKGDLESFAANGSQEGLFVLPNYLTKETWFPSEVAIQPNPLERIIESGGKPYNFRFTDGNVEAFE